VIPVWLFIAGLLVGLVNYWLAGGALYLALTPLRGARRHTQGRPPVGTGGGAARAVARAPPCAASALWERHLPKRRCGLRFRSARLHGARGRVWALVGRVARDRNSCRRGLGMAENDRRDRGLRRPRRRRRPSAEPVRRLGVPRTRPTPRPGSSRCAAPRGSGAPARRRRSARVRPGSRWRGLHSA